jgi:glycosyltransferase involved in cell wall biosynthesis
VASFRPNVIEIHTPNLAWLAAWARLGVPCVHVLHGYGSITAYGSLKNFVMRMISRAAHRSLRAKLVTVSESMKPVAACYFGVERSALEGIPNGVDLEEFRSRIPDPGASPRILMIGTLSRYKGQLMGAEAFRRVLESMPAATLVVVGEGEDAPKLAAFAERHGLEGKMKLLGRRSDVAALLADSHVLWQLSESEAMPMVVLEAMSSGVPVVGFDVRGIRDAVVDGETGNLVPYGDVEAVATATVRMLQDPFRLRSMAAKGRERAENHFSLDSMIDRHREVLERTAGKVS